MLWNDLAAPVLLQTVLWTVGLGFAGVPAAVLVFLGVRGARGYRSASRHARAWRGATLLLMLLALPALSGAIGFFEGLYRGAERALRGERMAREVYPWVGQLGADAVGLAYFAYRDRTLDAGALRADLEAFRAGRSAVETSALAEAVGQLGPGAIDHAVEPALREARARYPSLGRGIGGALARFAVYRLGDALRAWSSGRLERWGLAAPGRWLGDTVRAAASRSGDPSTLSHAELAAELVDGTLVRSALSAVRLYARFHEALLEPWILLPIGGPIVLFWLARELAPPPEHGR